MKMMIRSLGAVALATLLFGSAAQARDACVQSCLEGARDCVFDARDLFGACQEEFACDEARDDFRAACFTQDRDVEACRDARDAYRACVEPCRADLHDDVAFCKDEGKSCIEAECGDENPRSRFLQYHRR